MLDKGDGIMATYIGAVEDFRKSATAFMQHVDLLAQARDAYQQAMTASADLRTVLDAGDENLQHGDFRPCNGNRGCEYPG